MEDKLTFQNTLADALDGRREWLDRNELPKLKDEFRVFQSSYTGLYTVLLKKGILHEDPYASDVKIGEIQCPSESPFSESNKIDEMSIRLSNYAAQLDFLLNYYQYSVDFITLDRIKRIVSLVKYFTWTQFSANSQNINTRTLFEFVSMIRGGNDSLSVSLVNDAIQQLERGSKNLFRLLKELSDFHRESYKVELRLRVMGQLALDSAAVFSRKDDTLRMIKRKFAESMADRPFYPELVEEILKEDYSSEGEELRSRLLASLAIPEEKPKERAGNVSFKVTLIEGARALGMASSSAETALRRLEDNSATLEAKKDGFWIKMRRLVRQMLNKEAEEIFYDVEYFDAVKSSSRSERLNFTTFREEAERLSKLLIALNMKGSSVSKRLESAEEDQALILLGKYIDEVQRIHKRMSALDTYFKSEVPREERDRMRGIKPELTAIRNAIVKANQKRHEYVAQKEEVEQMKRLGIKLDS